MCCLFALVTIVAPLTGKGCWGFYICIEPDLDYIITLLITVLEFFYVYYNLLRLSWNDIAEMCILKQRFFFFKFFNRLKNNTLTTLNWKAQPLYNDTVEPPRRLFLGIGSVFCFPLRNMKKIMFWIKKFPGRYFLLLPHTSRKIIREGLNRLHGTWHFGHNEQKHFCDEVPGGGGDGDPHAISKEELDIAV